MNERGIIIAFAMQPRSLGRGESDDSAFRQNVRKHLVLTTSDNFAILLDNVTCS